ncbi:hypothetical protein MMC24_007794 [Lignoscripta atroalba]|nr:hypothetical protein [Lignoscripta atroalba]
MAAVGPAQLDGGMETIDYDMAGSDLDAEGEDDLEVDYNMTDAPASEPADVVEDSDSVVDNDEVGEDDEDEDAEDDEEDEVVGAVKLPNGHEAESDEDAIVGDGSDASSVAEDDDSDKSSSEAESAVAEEWEGGSEGPDEAEAEVATRNNCMYVWKCFTVGPGADGNRFCGQDEEHDPCEEFEEYMACAVCGDNCKSIWVLKRSALMISPGVPGFSANRNAAHRQCARDAKSLTSEQDTDKWRCPDCVNNALEPDNTDEAVSRRRSSAPKFTRDLLPAQRGAPRPGSHSVFNNLILDDDPLDGSRSLRKRKASSDEVEEPTKVPNKRRKQVDLESESEGSESPSLEDDEDEHGRLPNIEVGGAKGEGGKAEIDGDMSFKSRSSRPARPRRPKNQESAKPLITIRKDKPGSITAVFRLDFSKIKETQTKKKRRRPMQHSTSVAPHTHFAPSHSSHYATPFYSFHERENDELKSKPYGGILSEAEADTSKTLPHAADRARFEEARQKAEDDWKIKTASTEAEGETKGRASQKVAGPPSKIKCINFGGYEIETWYAAPYPEEYSRNRVLYICEFCLKYMSSDYVAWRHKLKCPAKHPPGDEIYRDKSISVFEVDGRKNPVYCQNLCLLAKLFLGSKTLYYDVEPFLFYIMTEYDELGCHFVGYFSKEKRPSSQNNVSCILTLPIHQRKGYGNLLIEFSYLLTRVERKTGSPEKPLSDMGLVSYRNYWRLVLSYELLNQKSSLSIADISDRTGMTADDIVAALEALRALVRDPISKTYALRLDYDYFKQCIDKWEAKAYVKLNPEALVWTPYIMGRSNLAHYDRAPPLPTIAPREGDEDEKGIQPEGFLQPVKDAATSTGSQNSKPDGETSINLVDQLLPPDSSHLNHAESSTVPILSPNCVTGDLAPLTPAFSHTLPDMPPLKLSMSALQVNGVHSTTPVPPLQKIPPTRYEVFPPVPGTISRRRGGWKGGSRKSAVGGSAAATPVRRIGTNPGRKEGDAGNAAVGKSPRVGLGLGKGKGKGKSPRGNGGTPNGRRTRSTLDDEENVMDADQKPNGKEDEVMPREPGEAENVDSKGKMANGAYADLGEEDGDHRMGG